MTLNLNLNLNFKQGNNAVHKFSFDNKSRWSAQDSHVAEFYTAEYQYMHLSAPVYFVIPCGHNYTSERGQNQICGESAGCLTDAVVRRINEAAESPERWGDVELFFFRDYFFLLLYLCVLALMIM